MFEEQTDGEKPVYGEAVHYDFGQHWAGRMGAIPSLLVPVLVSEFLLAIFEVRFHRYTDTPPPLPTPSAGRGLFRPIFSLYRRCQSGPTPAPIWRKQRIPLPCLAAPLQPVNIGGIIHEVADFVCFMGWGD